MKKIFDEFEEEIPYINWRFFLKLEDVMELKDLYSISDKYEILGTDMLGDIITLKDNSIIILNHEVPDEENEYFITNDLEKLIILLKRLINVKDYIELDDTDNKKYLSELKKIKKDLKECKKLAPKDMKDDFEDFIEEIESEIDLVSD